LPSARPEPAIPDASPTDSGAQDLIGYVLDFTGGDGAARVILDIAPRHLNRNGTLHGGIIAMMLDAAAGFAASRAAPGPGFVPVVTVSLNTRFLAPASAGRVVATGWFAGGGTRLLHADAELRDEAGALLAGAAGVFKRTGAGGVS